MDSTATPACIVGAYAAVPGDEAGAAAFHRGLAQADWCDGLEIPYPGGSRTRLADAVGLAAIGSFSVLTLIPGTMHNLAVDPAFGLASPEADARARAVAWTREALDQVGRVHDEAGRRVVARVEVHSAPTRLASAEALRASLSELTAPAEKAGTRLVLEHCDEWTVSHPVEKGFLGLDEEIAVVRELGLGIAINWGRAALERHCAEWAQECIEMTAAAGVLEGLMLSGISPVTTEFGDAWADAHVPASTEEPSSLLTPEAIRAAVAAGQGVAYQGVKIQASGPAAQRLAAVESIAKALGLAV